MNLLYENRSTDFYYRDNNSGTSQLKCRPHLHSCLELVCMIDGEVEGHSGNFNTTIEKSDIFLVFPYQVHKFVSYTTEQYLLFIINPVLMPEFSKLFASSLPTNPIVKNATVKNPKLLTLLYEIIKIHNAEKGRYSEIMLKGYLLAFFSELLKMMHLTEIRSENVDALSEIVSYCSKHFNENLSLEVLQEELHISKYYISHLFSNKLNMRFNDYINSLRISCACRYLSQTELSITEICDLVGFNTLRTFNRAFSKHFNISPSEYRRNIYSGSTKNIPMSYPT